jgi:hypothetical protein
MAIDPVTELLDVGGKVIDRLWPDPSQAAQAKLELIKLQRSGDLAQIAGQLEINKAEAVKIRAPSLQAVDPSLAGPAVLASRCSSSLVLWVSGSARSPGIR